MTLPAIKTGQIWRRADGTTTRVGLVTNSLGFYAGGSYYSGNESNGRYAAGSFNESLDLVELCEGEPSEESQQEGLSGVIPVATSTPRAYILQPRRLKSFDYSDGVFYGLAEDGTAWYLQEGDSAWVQLIPLPHS